MKRFTYLFLVGAFCQLAVLSSCDKDEEDNPIVETWTLFSIEYTDCDDPNDEDLDEYTCNVTDCQEITFTADGNYVNTQIDGGDTEIENGTYTLSGNQLTICDEDNDCELFTYTISGGTLTLTIPDAGCSQIIVLKK